METLNSQLFSTTPQSEDGDVEWPEEGLVCSEAYIFGLITLIGLLQNITSPQILLHW